LPAAQAGMEPGPAVAKQAGRGGMEACAAGPARIVENRLFRRSPASVKQRGRAWLAPVLV